MSDAAPFDPLKNDHDTILEIPIADISPARINDQIYKPVDHNDLSIREMATSMRQHGQLEPCVVTLDRVLLSGHRRRVACRLAGMKVLRCRVENILSTDAEFPTFLVEYNRQRVKSLDERVREEVIRADPEESHRALIAHREQLALVDADAITITGKKHRSRISKARALFLAAVLQVIESRRKYWPLSDRQVHYALLNAPPLIHASKPDSLYVNDKFSYRACTDLLTRARLEGKVSFQAIGDPTRPVVTWKSYRELGDFVRDQMDGFLKGYRRDLVQSQPNHIEIVGEKNTVEGVVRRVASRYCIPYTIGRGYCSLPPRKDMVDRFNRSGKEKLVLLVLSDFDPEGEDIPHSFARSLRDDFRIEGGRIVPIKVALTETQARQLPANHLEAKKSSSRYKKFVAKYGADVFELEALPPERLESVLADAVDSVIDARRFNSEIEAEKGDAANSEGTRRAVHEMLKTLPLSA